MPIDAFEYRQRLDRALDSMRRESLDLLCVYAQGYRGMHSNLLYLTGYSVFDPGLRGALLIQSDGNCRLLLDSAWDVERAIRSSTLGRKGVARAPDLEGGVIAYCLENGLDRGRIGLAGEDAMPSRPLRPLQAGLPAAEFVPSTDLILRQRLLKSPAEVEVLRRAADITGQGMMAGILALKEGISELAVLAVCARRMFELDGSEFAFTPEISFGAATEAGGGPATSATLRRGDMVLFDIGCLFEDYVGDLSCSFVYGVPSADQRAIFDCVVRAQEAAIRMVCPGVPASEIDRAARQVIDQAGYGQHFNHDLGHGQGLDHHEAPFIGPDSGVVLAPGMVFSVEPGIYLPGVGGVRIEHTVLVTETGCEVLSAESTNAPPISVGA